MTERRENRRALDLDPIGNHLNPIRLNTELH